MILAELLATLEARSVRLWLEGEELRFSAPNGVVQGELRDRLVASKPALIGFLRGRDSTPRQTVAAPLQEMLWTLCMREAGAPELYIEARIARLSPGIDFDALERAVAALVARHAALRTRLTVVDGQLMQIIDPPATPLARRLPAAPDDTGLRAIAFTAFNLDGGPLSRIILCEGAAPAIVLSQHHTVTDRWSAGILLRDLSTLYDAEMRGAVPVLPPLLTDYGAYAQRAQAGRTSARHGELLAYWNKALSGAPNCLSLPVDRPWTSASDFAGGRHLATMPAACVEAMEAFCRERGCTPFMVLAAAYGAFLHRICGQDDVIIGTPLSSRPDPALEDVAGFFVNSLPLRLRLDPDQRFDALLDDVCARALDLIDHGDLCFADLLAAMPVERDAPYPPIYQAMLVVQNMEMHDLLLAGATLTDVDTGVSHAKYPLLLTAIPGANRLQLVWDFQSALFDAATIAAMADNFLVLLQACLANPALAIGELPVLCDAEATRLFEATASGHLLPDSQSTPKTLPSVYARFSETAAHHAGRIAVETETGRLTYAQAAAQAECYAAHLASAGVGPGDRVGLSLPRSADTIVAMLAILRQGAVYVPLDPEYPEERLRFMASDSGISMLVSDRQTGWSDVPCLPPPSALPAETAAPAPTPALIDGEAAAYVMYTSGSTGLPKGVVVPHRGITRLVCGADYIAFHERQTFLQVAPTSFDASTFEIWGALLNGARLVVPPPGSDWLDRLGDLIEQHEVTVLWLTAGLFALMIDRDPDALSRLDVLLAGGDALSAPHVSRALSAFTRTRLINGYGPTENTTFTTTRVLAAQDGRILVGRPIGRTVVHVLDARGSPVPVGSVGELHCGGEGLALGYHDRPELTAQAFRCHTLRYGAREVCQRLYATGDLARWVPDGDHLALELLGRRDDQVKIRGNRVEPGEVESAISAIGGVADCAVVVIRDSGDAGLAAFIVPDGSRALAATDLRAMLAARLPSYAMPSRLEVVDALPLTANGKVDRAALLALPVAQTARADPAADPPRPGTEQAVARIWQEFLGTAPLDRDAQFFDLGGHSLMAVRMAFRVEEAMKAAGNPVKVPMRTVFETPVLKDFCKAIDAGHAPATMPERRGIVQDIPLSFSQERIWTLTRLFDLGGSYTVPGAFRIAGALDGSGLARAVASMVDRHSALRTVFRDTAAGAVQDILPAIPLDMEIRETTEGDLASGLADFVAQPFDLAGAPLFRTRLFRLDARTHVLALAMHHLICDGWSVQVLMEDLARAYAGDALPATAIDFADFALWQRETGYPERAAKLEAFWSERLRDLPDLALPTDRARPALPSHCGGTVRLALPTALLDGACRVHGVTLFTLIAAGFAAYLQRLSGQEDFAIGTPIADRTVAGTGSLVGLLTETLALRVRPAGSLPFADFLQTVRADFIDALDHQDMPFAELVRLLNPPRRLDSTPLFQVMVAVDEGLSLDLNLPGLHICPEPLPGEWAKFDLTLNVRREAEGMIATLEYAADLFSDEHATRLADSFGAFLTAACTAPQTRIVTLPVASPDGASAVLRGARHDHWQAGGLPLAIARQAANSPRAVAVIAADGSPALDHASLQVRAATLAAALFEAGLIPGGRVGVHLRKSPDLVVALLAIWRCGGVYVPLNPDHPADRLATIARQLTPLVVISSEDLPHGMDASAIVRPDAAASGPAHDQMVKMGPEDIAFAFFTSGSTGKPKGVEISHRAIANHLGWFIRSFEVGPDDRFLQMTGIDFDPSMIELLAPLLTGGALVMPDPAHSDAGTLAALAKMHGVSVMQAVPSMWHVFLGERLLGHGGDALRVIISGGEALSGALMQRLCSAFPQAAVWNMYGPTETCIDALGWPCDAAAPDVVLGHPLDNLLAVVLDAEGIPLPEGFTGELAIGGPGLATGYLGLAAETARAFIETPLGRLYRTGDKARVGPAGIVYLGRLDRQMKLRGQRVEPEEIEAALATVDGVTACAATIVDDELVVAVEGAMPPRADMDAAVLRRLPRGFRPSRYVYMPHLPRGASGKLDRQAIARAIAATGVETVASDLPLEGETARRIAETMREVLGGLPADTGQATNFFDAGGNSLSAVRLAVRLQDAFATPITVRDIFERSSIGALAAWLDGRAVPLPPAPSPALMLASRGALERAPASWPQRALWFLDQMEGGNAAYTTASAFIINGSPDWQALGMALDTIVARHAPLRTRFVEGGDGVDQIIDPPAPLPIMRDITDAALTSDHIRSLVVAYLGRPFDLAKDWPIRLYVVSRGDTSHAAVLLWHHIATDGWSLGLFIAELSAAYSAFRGGNVPADIRAALPELPVSYADYALWQADHLASPAFAGKLDYWRTALADAPQRLSLPLDFPRPRRQTFRGSTHRTTIAPGTAAAMRQRAQDTGTSLFMLGMAGFLAALHRWSRQDDMLVGVPNANRPAPALERLIGFFANSLVIRGQVAKDMTFAALLGQVRDRALSAFEHAEVPFERIVDALDPRRDTGSSPIFQVMFNHQNTPATELVLDGLAVSGVETDSGSAKYDLLVTLIDSPDGSIEVHWEYSTDLFRPETAARMATQFVTLLEHATASPDCPVGRLTLGNGLVLHGETAPQDDTLLHHLFEARAATCPDAEALRYNGRSLTYGELDRWAVDIAAMLCAHGFAPGGRVGMALERGPAMIAGLLGILKAGGAYVPIDRSLPAARRARIAGDADLACCIVGPAGDPALPDGIVRLEVGAPGAACPATAHPAGSNAAPAAAQAGKRDAADACYVLYTSGSTGAPKGVVMPHRALVNLIRWQVAQPGFAEGQRCLQFTTISFDVATQEIFATLASGGTLVLIDEALRHDMPALLQLLADERVARLFLPFTALQQLAEAHALSGIIPAELEDVITAGERLHVTHNVKALFDALPQTRLVNQYGPTETHVATALPLPDDRQAWPEFPSIGRPVSNTDIIILDEAGEVMPPGVPGEVCVAGIALASGYLGDADRTRERFMPSPLDPGRMIYATGDLGILRTDGQGGIELDYLGRIDQQIKIRGFRVEPGEIEHALANLDAVSDAAIIVWRGGEGGTAQLVAHIVPASGMLQDDAPGTLRRALSALLPDYMVPTYWMLHSALPLSATGKLDRKALPDPASAAFISPARTIVTPWGEVEQQVLAIWRATLAREDIGADDNFFDMGGSSFLLLRLRAALVEAFPSHGDLRMVSLFEHPTVAAQARLLSGAAPDLIPTTARARERTEGTLAARRSRRRGPAAAGDEG